MTEPNYERAWRALSDPLSWMHENQGMKAYWGWNLADIANDLIDRAYPGLRNGKATLATAEAASGAVATAATTTEDQLRRIQLLADVELHLKSCRIFLTSREKMHPCGIELHDELLANVTAAIEQEGRNG